jgi:hypothetical protein
MPYKGVIQCDAGIFYLTQQEPRTQRSAVAPGESHRYRFNIPDDVRPRAHPNHHRLECFKKVDN